MNYWRIVNSQIPKKIPSTVGLHSHLLNKLLQSLLNLCDFLCDTETFKHIYLDQIIQFPIYRFLFWVAASEKHIKRVFIQLKSPSESV